MSFDAFRLGIPAQDSIKCTSYSSTSKRYDQKGGVMHQTKCWVNSSHDEKTKRCTSDPIMIVFQKGILFILAITFGLALSLSPNNTDICKEVPFYRRPDMDDVVFTESLIEETNQVDMRAECFAQCHRRELCNLVLYNPLTRKCRLYTEVFGSVSHGEVEAGWQYYGISCANFRLGNAHADVDVINTAPKDVCHSNIIVSDDNTSSCYTGASWEVVPVKCVTCYTGLPKQFPQAYAEHTEELTFDLAAGMKVNLIVSGDAKEKSDVWMVNPAEDFVYVLSLRWSTTPTVAVFNTRQAGVFGGEEALYGISVNNSRNYSIEIHISQSTFETFFDGALWMTNQMRLPFVDVRHVKAAGFTALRSFHVGYGMC